MARHQASESTPSPVLAQDNSTTHQRQDLMASAQEQHTNDETASPEIDAMPSTEVEGSLGKGEEKEKQWQEEEEEEGQDENGEEEGEEKEKEVEGEEEEEEAEEEETDAEARQYLLDELEWEWQWDWQWETEPARCECLGCVCDGLVAEPPYPLCDGCLRDCWGVMVDGGVRIEGVQFA